MTKIKHKEIDTNLLGARVFNILQEDIINGVYKSGDSLIETKLSTELGVSRTPIREAIRKLEIEGLVQCIPNKGVFVTGVSPKDIEDIYTIRMMIEGLAARWAAENITEEELSELKEVIDLEEFYTSKNDLDHLLNLDSKFHDIIYRASRSKPLVFMLGMFHHYVQRARNNSFEFPGRAIKVFDEHKAIMQAIADRDKDSAEKLTTEHIKNAKNRLFSE